MLEGYREKVINTRYHLVNKRTHFPACMFLKTRNGTMPAYLNLEQGISFYCSPLSNICQEFQDNLMKGTRVENVYY